MNKAPIIIPILLIEDNPQRVVWFQNHLPIGFRLIHACSAGLALGILERDRGHVYGGILLDHDLQLNTITARDHGLSGTQVVDGILRTVSRDVPVMIHSMNPEKSPVMAARLESAGFQVSKTPWFEMTEALYLQWLEAVGEEWAYFLEEPG